MLMTALCTLGLVLMAVCKNVETYAAAQVFYWVGYNGMGYVISIFLADTTSLRNRMIMFGLNSTPFIATVFAGPHIAQLFHNNSSFRWAFACFSVIVPVMSIPVVGVFVYSNFKAKKLGLIPPRIASGRTFTQGLYHYAREFDRMSQNPGYLTIATDMLSSSRNEPRDCRFQSATFAAHHRCQCRQSMAHALHYWHARRWRLSSGSLLRMGEILRASDIRTL